MFLSYVFSNFFRAIVCLKKIICAILKFCCSENSNVISCGMTGSPLYMAPERILERPNSCAVDVWSSGVILFVLLVCLYLTSCAWGG